MRGRLPSFQQPSRAAEQRAGADGEDDAFSLGVAPDERHDLLIVHEGLLPQAAGDVEDVKLGRILDRDRRRDGQPLDVLHRRRRLGNDLDGCLRDARKDLKRPSEVDLVHAREDQRTDADGTLSPTWSGPLAVCHGR